MQGTLWGLIGSEEINQQGSVFPFCQFAFVCGSVATGTQKTSPAYQQALGEVMTARHQGLPACQVLLEALHSQQCA